MMRHWQARTQGILLFLLIAAVAVLSRFYGLSFKPIHHDESVNMWWVSEIWSEGFFRYDPTNYHGPLLFYLFHWMEAQGAKSLESYRALCSLFNVAMMALIFWWSFSRKNQFWPVSILVLLSPAMIFFSRSGIHESAFIFFQVLAFIGVIEFFQYSRIKGLRFFIWGLLGTLLLKETFVLPLIAGIIVGLVGNRRSFKSMTTIEKKELALQSLLALLVWLLMYSGFFANPQGLLDFFKAFLPWTTTGVSGSGHEKSVLYWLQLILNHEPLAAIALIFTVSNFFSKKIFLRNLSLFALLNLLLYSLIPYKTPWCIISILWPIYFSGIAGFNHFWPIIRPSSRLVLITALVALSISQIKDVDAIAYKNPINFEHDYVYVQTTAGAQRAFEYIQNTADKARPALVYTANPWPFPAVLREFHRVYPLVPNKDTSTLPQGIGLIISEGSPTEQEELLKNLGLTRLVCDEVFETGLGPCEFEILKGSSVYQLIFTK